MWDYSLRQEWDCFGVVQCIGCPYWIIYSCRKWLTRAVSLLFSHKLYWCPFIFLVLFVISCSDWLNFGKAYLYGHPCPDPIPAIVFSLYSSQLLIQALDSRRYEVHADACWCILTTVINTFIHHSNTTFFPQLTAHLFWKRHGHMLFCSSSFFFFFSWKNRQQVLTSKDLPLMAGICHGYNRVGIHLSCVPRRTCWGFCWLV